MNENLNPNNLNADDDPLGLNETYNTFFGDILDERADGDHIPADVANAAMKAETEYVTVLSQDGDTGEYFEEKITREEYDRLVSAGVYKPADEGGNDDDDPDGDPDDDPNGEYDPADVDPADEALDKLIDEVAALEQAEFEAREMAVEAERDAVEAELDDDEVDPGLRAAMRACWPREDTDEDEDDELLQKLIEDEDGGDAPEQAVERERAAVESDLDAMRPLSEFGNLAKPATLRRAAIEGRLNAEKAGRNWFTTRRAVLRYLKRSTRPAVTLRGLLEQVTDEARAWAWDKRVFSAALELAHAKISALGEGASAPLPQNDIRFVLHQALNRLAHQRRAEATGQPLVVWFFDRSANAEEYSLFDGGTETIPDVFGPSVRGTIIGLGCKDMAEAYSHVRVQPLFYSDGERIKFDPNQSYDWGWEDPQGEHIEYYDSTAHTFVRSSMSGRRDYAIRIDADGRVIAIDADPQLLMQHVDIDALLDLNLARGVRWSAAARPVFGRGDIFAVRTIEGA